MRTLFPRPKLEDSINEISSIPTSLATDPYSLAKCVGDFPRLDACILLEKLDASQLASFKLSVDIDSFTSLKPPNLSNDGSFPSPVQH